MSHWNVRHKLNDKTRALAYTYIKGDITLYKMAKELKCGTTTAYILIVRVMKEAYEAGKITIK